MLDWKKELKLAFSENKLAIYVAIAIFTPSLIAGYFLQPYLNDFLNPVLDNLSKRIHEGSIKITFQSIFRNNIRITFLMFIMGVLCCFSALILAFNGLFIGFFVAVQDNLFETLLYLIPHGIFELPACVIACASGFVLFNFLVKFVKSYLKPETTLISYRLNNAFDLSFDKLKQAFILFAVAAILMFIAGIVEAYLTIPIAEFLISIS